MVLTLLIVSITINVYLLDKLRVKNQQLKYQKDDIEYWKIISEKAKYQYDLLLKWNKSWK